MDTYCVHTLEGASPVELVVALYDGIIRYLHCAVDAVDRGDVRGRRAAVKRALDIIIHLQAHLKMDIGGTPAQALGEFYVATFAQILQASQSASRPKFERAIHCVQNVREAWKQAAQQCAGTGYPFSLDAAVQLPRQEKVTGSRQPLTDTRWTA
jgi:flagellar secretion chaperone FliS